MKVGRGVSIFENQFKFMLQRSIPQKVIHLVKRSTARECRVRKKDLYIVFIDQYKIYDKVPRDLYIVFIGEIDDDVIHHLV